MTLEQLRYFLALYDERSFTEAARSFFITQPALSNSIARLEKELGRKLFDRDGHDLLPTEFGEDIAGYARRIVGSYDEMMRYVDLANGSRGGKAKLLCTPFYVDWILEEGMPLFLRRFKHVEYSLEKADNPDIFDQMAEPGGPQAAVFAPTERYLGLYQKLMEKHGLTFDIWLQSGYCAFVSINHPWSGKAAVSVEDIEDGTYIEYDGYRDKGISQASKIVVTAEGPQENQLLTTDSGYIFKSILSGEKIGIFPGMCAVNNFFVQHGFIKVVPLADLPETMFVGLLSKAGECPSENLAALETCLKQVARRSAERTSFGVEVVTKKQGAAILERSGRASAS